MSRYRIVKSKMRGDRYLIQKKSLFGWGFVDFYGCWSAPDEWCSYPTYERAKECLDDMMTNYGKYDIIEEVEVNDVKTFTRVKRV